MTDRMVDDQRKRILGLYVAAKAVPATALLVDHDDMLKDVLTEAGATVGVRQAQIFGRVYDASDLWFGTQPGSYRMVVLHRKKSSKELFRDLSICGTLVVPGGSLVMSCLTNAQVDHCYQEASEIFLSAEIGWTRTLYQTSNVIEMKRAS